MLTVDAIAAIATAPGRGGVGIIRMSIPDAVPGFQQSFSTFCQSAFGRVPLPRQAHLVCVLDHTTQPLDEGILLYFPAPASFTGEHVLEFQGHGGPALLNMLLRRLLDLGRALSLRLARPGEFTERAFLNGKLDLAQAEAVADLIDAGSAKAAHAAMGSLRGAFSSRVNALADELIALRLLVEATLDFPEEEIDFLQQSDAVSRLARCQQQLRELLRVGRDSQKLASGLRLVLVGEPNVGKSSLLNALTGEDRAIVTPIAGTTRDAIHQDMTLDGIPVTLIDTAGLRDTDDPVEKIGIQKTLQEIARADVLLHLQDSRQLPSESPSSFPFHYDGPVLSVLNKADLLDASHQQLITHQAPLAVLVSAKTGAGLDALKKAIFRLAQCDIEHDFAFLARERHLQALQQSLLHADCAAEHAAHGDLSLDLFAEELRLAHDALGEITGRVLPDDLLGLIFSRFCIGK